MYSPEIIVRRLLVQQARCPADSDDALLGFAGRAAVSLGQSGEQVSRHQRVLAHGLRSDVACQSMQVHRRDGGARGVVWHLPDDARGHAGQDVARPACRHAGIAGGIDPRRAVRQRDDGAVAFQHQHQIVLARERRARH